MVVAVDGASAEVGTGEVDVEGAVGAGRLERRAWIRAVR